MEERPISDSAYEAFLKEEKLMGSRCRECGQIYFPPRPLCLKCQCDSMAWEALNGSGKLIAFTCISVGPPFMVQQGYDRKNPYCSGVVDLDEGVRTAARIEGVDCKNPESIKLHAPVKVCFLHRTEGEKKETYLAFKPL